MKKSINLMSPRRESAPIAITARAQKKNLQVVKMRLTTSKVDFFFFFSGNFFLYGWFLTYFINAIFSYKYHWNTKQKNSNGILCFRREDLSSLYENYCEGNQSAEIENWVSVRRNVYRGIFRAWRWSSCNYTRHKHQQGLCTSIHILIIMEEWKFK